MSTDPSPPSAPRADHLPAQPRFGQVNIRNRGRLPHWEKDSGLYFLTFRLADSLPHHVLDRVLERNRILLAAKRSGIPLLPEQKVLIAEFNARKIEEYEDRGIGQCQLRDQRIAGAMAAALRHWHGKRYRLLAWCIMPNHVHVICRLFPGRELGGIVKGWKAQLSRSASHVLGHGGQIWQREYYDRLIRKEGELDRAIDYVLTNPIRANLSNWPWVWSDREPTQVPPL